MAEQSGGQVGDDPALAAKALRTLPVQKDLRRIADKCGNNGEKLLTLVGLQLTEIQGFLMDASTSSDAFFQGLVYWLGGNVDDSDPVNWSTLLTAMEDASMARDAGEWRQKIIERCAASLDRPRDAGQSGNDKTQTPGQEEPRSNVPQSATSKDQQAMDEPPTTPVEDQKTLALREAERYYTKPPKSKHFVKLALVERPPKVDKTKKDVKEFLEATAHGIDRYPGEQKNIEYETILTSTGSDSALVASAPALGPLLNVPSQPTSPKPVTTPPHQTTPPDPQPTPPDVGDLLEKYKDRILSDMMPKPISLRLEVEKVIDEGVALGISTNTNSDGNCLIYLHLMEQGNLKSLQTFATVLAIQDGNAKMQRLGKDLLKEITLLDALRNGAVKVKVVKCVLLGPPGVGKTQLKRALLNNFDEVKESTDVSTQAVPAVLLVAGSTKLEEFGAGHLKYLTKMKDVTNKSASIRSDNLEHGSTRPSDSSRLKELDKHIRLLDKEIEGAKHEGNYPPDSEFTLVYIIDNGGQPSFLDFHSVSANFPASYILVYNASKGLDDYPEVTFRKPDRQDDWKEIPASLFTNYDLLYRSLLTVYHFRSRFEKGWKKLHGLLPKFQQPRHPLTLMIGTHKDTSDQNCKSPDEAILKSLYERIPSLSDHGSIHCVDSRNSKCGKALEAIRSTIIREDNLCQFPLPLSWFKLYLLSLNTSVLPPVQRYKDLSRECYEMDLVTDPEEFKAMVTVMHYLGVFFCPDLDNTPDADFNELNIIVFVNPNLLFGYISEILSIPFLSPSASSLKNLQKLGELNKDCLTDLKIRDSLPNLPDFKFHDKLLEWLVNWGLAAKKEGEDHWFIPSVLPPRPKRETLLESPIKGFPLYLTFIQDNDTDDTFHHLPAGFFPLFVVQLVQFRQSGSLRFILFKNKSSNEYPPRCRDSILFSEKEDSKDKLNIHLVDEANHLAVYMSSARNSDDDKISDADTLARHAGAVLAELKDCMNQTNEKLLDRTDDIDLCSSCDCELSEGDPHLAKIFEDTACVSLFCKCLCHSREVPSQKKVDCKSRLATVLDGFYHPSEGRKQTAATGQSDNGKPDVPKLTNIEGPHSSPGDASIEDVTFFLPYLDEMMSQLIVLGVVLELGRFAPPGDSPSDKCINTLQEWLKRTVSPTVGKFCKCLEKATCFNNLRGTILPTASSMYSYI